MEDLGDDTNKCGKIKLVFKKNLGEWESFIKQSVYDKVKNDDDDLQSEGRHSKVPESQSSDEDIEISQQMNLMHVTRGLDLTNSNKNKSEILSNLACLTNQAFTSRMKAITSIDGNTERERNINLLLIKQSTEEFVRDEPQESTKYKANNIPFDHRKSDLDSGLPQNDIESLDLKTVESVIADHSMHAPLNKEFVSEPAEHPTLYLLPEFSDPSNLPRPPSHPSVGEQTILHPSFPVIQVVNYEHAHSRLMEECCSKQICCLIRGLCRVTNLKLEVFSTATLRQTFGDYNMEIRVQKKLRNNRRKLANKTWNFQSKPSSITINQFAKYQALSFLKASSVNNNSKSLSRKEIIHFGTNVDLSNFEIWKEQLQELEKLPNFLKVYCPEINMLNHIGHNVLGVNTVQLYMKVPGCRTPGHQENNNFSAININIGPGSCQWFCVADSYWGVIYDLCKKRGINYSSGSWWPDLKDLINNDVPVYQVLQEPGDVIWIGPGTIHWVQSIGWCNNVAWNVGPMSERQFRSAIERYEYNRIHPPYKSIVPMVQLSWNLAHHFLKQDSNAGVDINYAERIFRVISASLRYCKEILVRIQRLGKRSVRQDRLPSDLAHYCEICLNEVFNIIFAHKNLVHCYACAIKKSSCLKEFYVLEEYSLEGLQNVVDEFALKIVTFS